jgi:hypothetical protein
MLAETDEGNPSMSDRSTEPPDPFQALEAEMIAESRQSRFNDSVAIRIMWTIIALMYAPLAAWFLMLLVPILTADNRTPGYAVCAGAYSLGVLVFMAWPKR